MKIINKYNVKESLNNPKSLNESTFNISKLGIVARDYSELNGNSDFSTSIFEILDYLDSQKCDSVLFSLFTILDKNTITSKMLNSKKYQNLKSIFIEEFKYENKDRIANFFKIYQNLGNDWSNYEIIQKFGKLKYTKKFNVEIISPFMKEVKTNRITGNALVLLCGETNIVKYSKETKKIEDKFNLINQIPDTVKFILNPIHDKMIRFEMKLKRQFLSKDNKVVVSVWNKGKTFANGKTRDGLTPPWTIFYNEIEILVNKENVNLSKNNSRIDIGIIDIEQFKKTAKK